MAADNPHRIRLHGRDDDRREGVATAAVSPGNLIELTGETAGVATEAQVQNHSTAAEVGAAVAIAVEYSMTGRDITDDYQADDNLHYFYGLRGERYYVAHATDEDVAYNDPLVSAGDGTLRALDTAGGDTAPATIFRAREAVTNAGDGTRKMFIAEVV